MFIFQGFVFVDYLKWNKASEVFVDPNLFSYAVLCKRTRCNWSIKQLVMQLVYTDVF